MLNNESCNVDRDCDPQHESCDLHYSTDPELNEIGRKLLTLGAQINAASFTWLMLLAEFDRRGGWEVDGVASCAQWLSWQGGITPGTAREKVRVAKALCELPGTCDVFSQGKLSYSQVRALTRVASVENEHFLLHIAEHGTAAHLEDLVRKYRLYKEDVEDYEFSTFELRDVDWYEDDRGMTVVKARLTREQGEVVIKALKECVFTLNGEDRLPVLEAQREAALNVASGDDVCDRHHKTIIYPVKTIY